MCAFQTIERRARHNELHAPTLFLVQEIDERLDDKILLIRYRLTRKFSGKSITAKPG